MSKKKESMVSFIELSYDEIPGKDEPIPEKLKGSIFTHDDFEVIDIFSRSIAISKVYKWMHLDPTEGLKWFRDELERTGFLDRALAVGDKFPHYRFGAIHIYHDAVDGEPIVALAYRSDAIDDDITVVCDCYWPTVSEGGESK